MDETTFIKGAENTDHTKLCQWEIGNRSIIPALAQNRSQELDTSFRDRTPKLISKCLAACFGLRPFAQ